MIRSYNEKQLNRNQKLHFIVKVLLVVFHHLCLVSPSSPSSPTTSPPPPHFSTTTSTPVLKRVSVWNVFTKTVLWRRVDALCFSLCLPTFLVSCNIKAYWRRFSFGRYSSFRGRSLAFHGHTVWFLEGKKRAVNQIDYGFTWATFGHKVKTSMLDVGAMSWWQGFSNDINWQEETAQWCPHNQVW